MNRKQPPKIMKLFIGIFVLLLLGIASYLVWTNLNHQPESIFCTQEAKLCPDGSYVGRTGPKCEFTSCPENISLPIGYTLNTYSVEKILETACTKNGDCETPMEYKLMSRCPFVSICLRHKCNVVCPAREN